MNTDPCPSVLLTRKSFASCQGFSSAGLLGAHASCVQGVRHPGHAGSVRSQGRNLRVLCVSAVRFGVQALACTVQPEDWGGGELTADFKLTRSRRSTRRAWLLVAFMWVAYFLNYSD